MFDFVLEGGGAEDDQPICGGSMRILIDPTAAAHSAAYAKAVEAERERQRGVLLTSVRTGASPHSGAAKQSCAGSRRAVARPGAVPAHIGFPGSDAVRAALERQTPEFLAQDEPHAGAQLQVLVEPLVPPPLLVIAGGGHIGQALALQVGLALTPSGQMTIPAPADPQVRPPLEVPTSKPARAQATCAARPPIPAPTITTLVDPAAYPLTPISTEDQSMSFMTRRDGRRYKAGSGPGCRDGLSVREPLSYA